MIASSDSGSEVPLVGGRAAGCAIRLFDAEKVTSAAETPDDASGDFSGVGEVAFDEGQQVSNTPFPPPLFWAKQRTPKKRSILELFTVAPPTRGGKEGRSPISRTRHPRRGKAGAQLSLSQIFELFQYFI